MIDSVVSRSVSQSADAGNTELVEFLLADLRLAASATYVVHGFLESTRSGVFEFLALEKSTRKLTGLRMTAHGRTVDDSREEYRVRTFDLGARFRTPPDASCEDCDSHVSATDESCGACGLHLADNEVVLSTIPLSPEDEIETVQRAVGDGHRVLGRLSPTAANWFFTVQSATNAICAVRVRRVPTRSGVPPFNYVPVAAHTFGRSRPATDREKAPSSISIMRCPSCKREYETDSKFCQHCGAQLVLRGQTEPLVGTTVAGKYHVQKRLGKGGFGTVYLVEHATMGRLEALKLMRPDHGTDPDMIKRFEREAKNAARVRSEHVAVVYDSGRDSSGALYIAMEYIEGPTLGERLQSGPMDVGEALKVGAQICRALAVAHSLAPPVVHRDLKPANIMLARGSDGSVSAKVVDFGISKAVGDPSQSVSGTGTEIGTWPYMSPEQFSAVDVDARSDVYAFGCVLYEMLTGVRAYPQRTKEGIVHAKVMGAPPSVREHRRDVPESVEAIVRRCLTTRTERYASADQVRREIERVIEGASAPRGQGAGRVEPTPEEKAKPRAPVPVRRLVAIGLAAAVLVAVVAFAMNRDPSDSSTPDDSTASGADDSARAAIARATDSARLASVRSDLRNARTAQEAFFTDSLRYADRMSALRLSASQGNELRVVAAGSAGFTIVATNPSAPQCLLRVGNGGDRVGEDSAGLRVGSAIIVDVAGVDRSRAQYDSVLRENAGNPICASRVVTTDAGTPAILTARRRVAPVDRPPPANTLTSEDRQMVRYQLDVSNTFAASVDFANARNALDGAVTRLLGRTVTGERDSLLSIVRGSIATQRRQCLSIRRVVDSTFTCPAP